MDRKNALEITDWLINAQHIDKWNNPFTLINSIYDDFEAHTCLNCKFKDEDLCTNIELNDFFPLGLHGNTYLFEPPIDFGCNKWQERD